jgi:dihydrofolate reductase
VGVLKVLCYLSADGVMEDPRGFEGSAAGGWIDPYWTDEIAAAQHAELATSDAIVLGRITYDLFARTWPSSDEGAFAERMNLLPKWVASTTLEHAAWSNTQVIRDDVTGAIRELKRTSAGDVVVYCSGALVRTLMAHDLVDRFRLLVFPVVLGRGKGLFDEAPQARLRVVRTTRFRTGVVATEYEPDRP